MTVLRTLVLAVVLSIAVGMAHRWLTQLVQASGAQSASALILSILLAAFLGVLTAVATRMVRLPGATAPTALVIGFTMVAGSLAATGVWPSLRLPTAGLSAAQTVALAAACVAAAVTLAVPADRAR